MNAYCLKSDSRSVVSRVMKLLLLQLAFLGLLCLPARGWVLKRDNQSEPLKELSQLQIRELFLSALQEYMDTKGIQVNKTAPAFVLTSRYRDTGNHVRQSEQDTVTYD